MEVGCREFSALSLARAFSHLSVEGERKERVLTKRQRGLKDDVAQKRRARESKVAISTRWGLISPGWVTWRRVYDVKDLMIESNHVGHKDMLQ